MIHNPSTYLIGHYYMSKEWNAAILMAALHFLLIIKTGYGNYFAASFGMYVIIHFKLT